MNEEIKTQSTSDEKPVFPLDADKEKENFANSSKEKTDTNSTDSSNQDKKKTEDKKGGEDNFADHPRWKERETDWTKRFNEQETRHVDEIAKLRQEIDEKYGKKNTGSESVQVPAWFGGDEDAWKEYLGFLEKQNEGILTKAEERALNRITAKQTEEQKAIDVATTYFNESVATIESDKTINPDGTKVDRNKLLKFTLDNDLVDSKGRWNYRAAFQLMKAGVTSTKNNSTDEKKKIAAATTSENRAEEKKAGFTTSADFAKPGARPW